MCSSISDVITSSWVFKSKIFCEVFCFGSIIKVGFVFKIGGVSFEC